MYSTCTLGIQTILFKGDSSFLLNKFKVARLFIFQTKLWYCDYSICRLETKVSFRIIVDLGGHINTYSGKVPPSTSKNIFDTASDDNETLEITNDGSVSLDFGRGANSGDMGGAPVSIPAGITKKVTVINLGPSGNKYLNVKNGSTETGSYKVLRM